MTSGQAIDYRRAIVAPFAGPEWAMTLLWVTLAMLVPIVGPIVAFGYQATMIEAMAREGVAAGFPAFQLERAQEYLLRGVRIFLVSLVVSVVVTPLAFVCFLGGNVLAAVLMSRHEAAGTILGFMLLGIGAFLFFLVIVLVVTVVTPLWIKAALESDLGRVFDLAFLRDFLRRAGREALVAHMLLFVLNLGFMMVGFLLCFVGMFPAIAIVMLVQAHVHGQLYLLYLARGGAAIPLPAPVPPAIGWTPPAPPR